MSSLLVSLTLLLGVVPLGLFIFRVKVKNKAYVPFLVLSLLASIYELVASFILKVNVTHWFQIYSLLEFLSIYYLFKNLLMKRPKGYNIVFLGLFFVVYIYSFSLSFSDGLSFLKAKSLNKSVLTLFVMVSSFLWIKQTLEQKRILKLYNEPSFYFVMGLFTYYSTTISLFVLSNSIANSTLYLLDFWLLNIISSLILRLVIIVGVWKMI